LSFTRVAIIIIAASLLKAILKKKSKQCHFYRHHRDEHCNYVLIFGMKEIAEEAEKWLRRL
jgi:hypothetical protein